MECYSDGNVETGLLKSHPIWWEMITSEGLLPAYKRAMALPFPPIFTYRPVII